MSTRLKPQGPSRKEGSVQARCRESGGAHGLKTIEKITRKKIQDHSCKKVRGRSR